LSFLHFRAVLMSYCPHLWGSRVIYKVHDTQYQFKRHDKNSSFLRFRAIFVSYCPLFWGSMEIYKAHDTEYILERNGDFFLSFLSLWIFSWAIAHNFGVPGWSTRTMTLSTCLRGMTKTCLFCVLGPFSWAIAHYFGFTWRFTRNMIVYTF
jgi:hypothetical protein